MSNILLYRQIAVFAKIIRLQHPFCQIRIFFQRFLVKGVTGMETLLNLPFHRTYYSSAKIRRTQFIIDKQDKTFRIGYVKSFCS